MPTRRLPARLPELFGAEHERTYGFRAPPDEPVELIGLSVIARGMPERPRLPERFRPPPPCRKPPRLVSGDRVDRYAGDGPRQPCRCRAAGTADRAGIRRDVLWCRAIGRVSLDAFGNIRLQATQSVSV